MKPHHQPFPLGEGPVGTKSYLDACATIASQHGGVFGPDTPVGWPNRIGILSGCAWLMIISWQALFLKQLCPDNTKA